MDYSNKKRHFRFRAAYRKKYKKDEQQQVEGPRSGGFPPVSLGDKLGRDILPHLVDVSAAIDGLHDALWLVVVQDGEGLGIVAVKALDEGLGGIIRPLEEEGASLVVRHRGREGLAVRAKLHALGRAELHVVGAATALVHPAAADPFLKHRWVDLEGHHQGHGLPSLRQHLVQGLGLGHSAREAIQDEALAAIWLLDAVRDDADDDLVRNQAA
mmetsp:Transcript_88245/g.159114  ORF Transcript_88245/g.159114 Transcript_88245/m.159114 type:complete len:213 (-) Transcript_88245:441-1079(-)